MTEHSYIATNLYYDSRFDMQAAKLLPGECYFTTENMMIVTVVGSCVAACVRDRLSGIGGMAHFMVPEAPKEKRLELLSQGYGKYVMDMLVKSIEDAGANRRSLEAKVFGGGVLNRGGVNAQAVGVRTADFVRRYLAEKEIPSVAEDLSDIYPRKVYFFPKSGRVLVKKIKEMHNNTVRNREADYGSLLLKAVMNAA